jgi:hypothetical protein
VNLKLQLNKSADADSRSENQDNGMITRISRQIERVANIKVLLVLFIFLLPFNLFLFPLRSQRLAEYLGSKIPVLDTHFYYTPDQVHQYFSRLGRPGRELYALSEVTLDLLYPLLYGTFLSLILSWLYTRLFPAGGHFRLLPLIPLAGVLADLGENLSLVVLLLAYPISLSWLVYVANLYTLSKWFAGLLSLFLILLGTGAYIVKWLRDPQK